jgi:hypothetical protein
VTRPEFGPRFPRRKRRERMQMRTWMLPGAVAAVALAAPAAAHGAQVTFEGSTLVYTADPGFDSPMIVKSYESGRMLIMDWGNTSVPAGSNCTSGGFSVECDWPAAIRIRLGAGNDKPIVGTDVPAGLPVELHGEAGDDELWDRREQGAGVMDGGSGSDTLAAGGGASVLRGGPGNDALAGGGGNDVLDGGEDFDSLSGGSGADLIDGGAGLDAIAFGEWSGTGLSLSLDGAANDGLAGERDNVVRVETIELGARGTYIGSDGPERFRFSDYTGAAPVVASGRGGDDTLTGGNGVERLDGGAGNDRLEGGFNHDTIVGGPGRDTIYGDRTAAQCGGYGQSCTVPFGNDTIDARDGGPDQIDCGVGQDTALVDPVDVVANCETVYGKSSAAPAPAPAANDDRPRPPAVRVVSRRSLRSLVRSGLRLRVACAAACRVRAELVASRAGAKRLKLGRSRRVAAASRRLSRAGTASVRLKPSRAVGRRVVRLRSARWTLRVRVTPAGGRTVTTTRRLALRR